MAPSAPTMIACTTAAEFATQFKNIATSLALPETEDNWEKIARAIQTITALCHGGAAELDPEYVTALKTHYKVINTSMLSERTRLSGTAIELISITGEQLGNRFEPLVQLFVPAVLKVLTRPNKVFVNRAQACLLRIIENCHLPSIVPHLREAVKDKSQALRLGAAEATLHLLNNFERQLLDVRQGSSALVSRHRGNAEDIESIIRDTACDANPSVRQVSRTTFEKYSESWPERVAAFTAPMTPTIIKYLNIKGGGGKPSSKNPSVLAKSRAPLDPPNAPPVAQTLRSKRSKARLAQPSDDVAKKEDSKLHAAPRPHSQMGQRNAEIDLLDGPRAGPSRPAGNPVLLPAREDAPPRAGPSRPVQTVFRPTTTGPSSDPTSFINTAPMRPPSRSTRQQPAPVPQLAPVPSSDTRTIPTSTFQASRVDVTSPPLLSSAPASGFTRVERPQVHRAPEPGPVRPAAPVRAASLWDAPSRPMRNPTSQIDDVVSVKAKFQPKPMSSHASKRTDSRPVIEKADPTPNNEMLQVNAELVEPVVQASVDVSEPIPLVPIQESLGVSRPASAASSVAPTVSSISQSETSNASVPSATKAIKRPAVLGRKIVAPPAGQVQGFAPTRRRAGLAEPTLSQLAKQKPHKVFVAAPKKLEVSHAVVKKVGSAQPRSHPQARAPIINAKMCAPARGEQPANDVAKAVTTPLPPVDSDEVASLKAGSVEAIANSKPHGHGASQTLPGLASQPSVEETPKVSRVAQPAVACVKSELPLLLDLDATIVLSPAPSHSRGGVQEFQDDLMDFDISVILPADRFAPMVSYGSTFAVHRDDINNVPRPLVSQVRGPMVVKPMSKEFSKADAVMEERRVLAERAFNVINGPSAPPLDIMSP